MRINKLLSNYGICSRKEARQYIEGKRVIVNGELCIQGQWVEESDNILLDNLPLEKKEKVYIAFNKPIGITCTAEKEVDSNIINFINYSGYIFPVGRLDKESQGLILLTNDGDIANKILESENMHEKEYVVRVNREYDNEFLLNLENGVEIGTVKTRKCKTCRINGDTFKIILTQGLNRQIRKMCRAFGYTVVFLERIRILNIKLDEIPIGEWRYLEREEVEYLMELSF